MNPHLVPETILTLVDRFERNLETYRATTYNETQIRREFIDPFFTALGWDVDNKQGFAEAYKDVIHEDAIKVSGATKAPDYSFRIGGARKFFVEAKKPSVNLKDDISPAFQLRRYAWSAKLPLSILTDFEEFAVYDCRSKPAQSDKSSVGRVLYFNYTEYAARWEEIACVFSKDAVLKGSFDKYAETNKAKKGTAEVDTAFLHEIENWRESLAKNIALRNPRLSQRELNFAVQRTIDRLIFLRICEDRGMETYGQLQALLNGEHVYARLGNLFHHADERYNSGIFHFQREKDRGTAPDELTLALQIDDKPLKEIIRNLYYPESPYEFSVLPADILGQVYEQFLGKVIRLTSGHRAVVEDKPEVKKAGGVYYTPTYIVDYIVQNTVGKLLEGKTPKQAAKLRVLDPACGSGSFLLGAYQHLLNWHRDWYMKDGPEKHATGKRPVLYQTANNDWRLTTTERKRILLANIFGVDIDSQAVEVTKLSLLLKVLEGENEQTITQQLKFFHERALPDLGHNIKCGNSLIGPDFYEQQMNLLDDEERLRLNAFDWQTEFAEIMQAGGFDAVIGNPPYLRIQGLQEYYGNQVDYYAAHYQSAVKRFDLYLLFAERGFQLLKDGGRLGFICPHKFLNSDFGSGLRSFLVEKNALETFISFGNNIVFSQAAVYTGIMLLHRRVDTVLKYYEFPNVPSLEMSKCLTNIDEIRFAKYDTQNFTSAPWVLTLSSTQAILDRIRQSITLGEAFESIFQGIVTGADEIYFLERRADTNEKFVEVYSQRAAKTVKIERDILKPLLKGEDVSRYSFPNFSNYCIYPYKLVGEKTVILEEVELSKSYPLAYRYLKQYQNELRGLRMKYKTNPVYWYSCHRGRSISLFERNRIIAQEISFGCNMTLATSGAYHNTTVYSLVPALSLKESIAFWLGLLNSNLLWWFLTNTGNVLRGGYFRFKTNYLSPFPIRLINFSDPADKSRHDRMVELVERMLGLHKQLAAAKLEHEQTVLKRQIAATDRQIDQLVYELYGLTEDEIKIVEEQS